MLAPAVLITSFDDRATDPQLVETVLERIDASRESAEQSPDVAAMHALLADEESEFDQLVPPELTDGAQVRIRTGFLDERRFPNGFIENRTVPVPLYSDEMRVIPPKWYQERIVGDTVPAGSPEMA